MLKGNYFFVNMKYVKWQILLKNLLTTQSDFFSNHFTLFIIVIVIIIIIVVIIIIIINIILSHVYIIILNTMTYKYPQIKYNSLHGLNIRGKIWNKCCQKAKHTRLMNNYNPWKNHK